MYVGQHAGTDLKAYWDRNVWLAESGYQGKRLLYRAIRKYGSGGFDVEILAVVQTKQETDYYEIELIKNLDTTNPEKGYNITSGGGGSLGVKMSKETRSKMSKAREGKKMSEENRLKFISRIKGNKFAAGRKMTENHFQKLMETHVGAKRSNEAKARMSEAHRGVPLSDSRRASMRKAQHIRYHVNRNIINPKCSLCQEAQ
jgi:group I intron endonuclease